MPTDKWFLERTLFLLAGIFILGSLALGFWVSEKFFLLTALVGASELIFGLTGFCLMALILEALGLKPRLKK